jgi:hypothetical protein
MSNIVQFHISRSDGFYTADGVNVPIVTQGETFEQLQDNIKEAVELYFEGEDPSSLGFGPSPSILTNFEVSVDIHGVKA